ncbi:MAG TPA: L-tyrosine/L-tryptophan isonitrile synthase family protein [Micavibrio sp.]
MDNAGIFHTHYKKSDPVIADLADIFIRFAGQCPGDESSRNKAVLQNAIRHTLAQRGQLDVVLPAFPFKSPNRDTKVLGIEPDFGEQAALGTLGNLCAALKDSVAVKLHIVSDGYVFNDLFGVPDDAVDRYSHALQEMDRSPDISFLRLKDLLGEGTVDNHRRSLMEQFAENRDDLIRRIHTQENDRILYTGIKRFMEESMTRAPHESKNTYQNRCGNLAKDVTGRSDAYSRLIEQRLPGMFRLTIHPRPDWTKKVPIRLVPSPDRWATPWHNVPVYDPERQTTTLMHKAEAVEKGYNLEFKDGQPWRYIIPHA